MRITVLLCLLLAACTPHGVRCDGRLRPINPPQGSSPAAEAP